METNDIARIVHECNKMYCEAIGDYSQVPWEDVAPEIQASAVDGVEYFMKHPDSDAEDMHDNWMKFKLSHGWKHGEEKSTFRKTHPCLVEYDELPKSQQMKDKLFMALCTTLQHVD